MSQINQECSADENFEAKIIWYHSGLTTGLPCSLCYKSRDPMNKSPTHRVIARHYLADVLCDGMRRTIEDVVSVVGERKFNHRNHIEYLEHSQQGYTWVVDGEALTSLTFESIDNIERCNRLSFRVFRVCDSITDDTFEESLQNTTCLFVDH